MKQLTSMDIHRITDVSYLMYLSELDETSATLVQSLNTYANMYANQDQVDAALSLYEKIYQIAPVPLKAILRNESVRRKIYRKLLPADNLTNDIAKARNEIIGLADRLYLGSGALKCISQGLNILQQEQPQELSSYKSPTICKSLILICANLVGEVIAPIDINYATNRTKYCKHWRLFADFFDVKHNLSTTQPVFCAYSTFYAGKNCKLLPRNNSND